MNTLKISLFGNFTCAFVNNANIDIEPRKAQELLCYLLLHRNQRHEREKLAALLWSEKNTSQSKKYLRQTLWQLQSILNIAPKQPDLLDIEHHQIGVNQDADLWLDVLFFDQAALVVGKTPGNQLNAQQAQLLMNTLPLYTGDLLDGWYQEWCIYERERYQMLYLTFLDKLTEYHGSRGKYELALNYGNAILKYDRARERTHRQLMRLLYLAGHRTQAIHQYETCVAALSEELGVPPAQSTVDLYAQICADHLTPQSFVPTEPIHRQAGFPAPKQLDARRELEQIQATLVVLQNRVTQLINQLELR